jgi:iron-sulfur cluster biosynthesis transcriptional regulator SufR
MVSVAVFREWAGRAGRSWMPGLPVFKKQQRLSKAMATSDVFNTQIPTTRRRILIALKERGGMTADELADRLGISPVAVRRHLTNLERDRLVDHEEEQRGIGRPSYVYRLTEAANRIFPNNYDQLASHVLETIQELYGPEAVSRIFEHRAQELARSYRPLITGGSLPDRLEQLIELREADGYMPALEQQEDGTYVLRQYHCPIIRVAEGCIEACSQELSLFVDLLDAEVIRQNHQVAGDKQCSYRIRPRP